MSNFDPIIKWEPLPSGMATKIAQSGWPIVEGRIAEAFGAGKVNDSTKVVWTEDGRRITVTIKDGVFMLSQSKEPDPLYIDALKTGHPANRQVINE